MQSELRHRTAHLDVTTAVSFGVVKARMLEPYQGTNDSGIKKREFMAVIVKIKNKNS
jgi:hypothetical protein